MNRTPSFYWATGELGIKADQRSSNYFFRPVSERQQKLTLGWKGISFQWQRGTWKHSSWNWTCLCQASLPTAPKAWQRSCFWSALLLLGCCSAMARSQILWRIVSSNECITKWSNVLKLPERLMQGLPPSLYLAFLICGSAYVCWR